MADQLQRLGIDPARPADLYAYDEPEDGARSAVPHRATFYTVGEIISGPGLWIEDARLGRLRHYAPLEGQAGVLALGLSVARAQDIFDRAAWHAQVPGPLLQVDFRLPVAWSIVEPRPSVFTGGPAVPSSHAV